MTTLAEIALPYRLAFIKYAGEFRRIFGKDLREFWQGNIIGFDVVAFDLWVNPEQQDSCKNVILDRFGDRAVKVIEDLMHGVDPS
jgi:hypothetical protein